MASNAAVGVFTRLVGGGDMSALWRGSALNSPTVQQASSFVCAPCFMPEEAWTQSSSNRDRDPLHVWLTANNAGRRNFYMMLAAGHADSRRRVPEARVGTRMVIDCDLAPATPAPCAEEPPM